MPYRIRHWRGVLYLRLFGGDHLFPYLVGRRLLILSEGVLDLPAGGLVVHPVYLPIQGEHAAAFPAPVALEHVLLQVQVELAFRLPTERAVRIQAHCILMPDTEVQEICHFPDGKRKILVQGPPPFRSLKPGCLFYKGSA